MVCLCLYEDAIELLAISCKFRACPTLDTYIDGRKQNKYYIIKKSLKHSISRLSPNYMLLVTVEPVGKPVPAHNISTCAEKCLTPLFASMPRVTLGLVGPTIHGTGYYSQRSLLAPVSGMLFQVGH